MSFGSQVYNLETDELTSASDGYLIFPFYWNTQKQFEDPNTQVNITVQEGSSLQMELATLFIQNKTGNYSYYPHILLIFQWLSTAFWNEVSPNIEIRKCTAVVHFEHALLVQIGISEKWCFDFSR